MKKTNECEQCLIKSIKEYEVIDRVLNCVLFSLLVIAVTLICFAIKACNYNNNKPMSAEYVEVEVYDMYSTKTSIFSANYEYTIVIISEDGELLEFKIKSNQMFLELDKVYLKVEDYDSYEKVSLVGFKSNTIKVMKGDLK